MEDADRFAIDGFQLIALKALMLPDGLQQALGGGSIPIMQQQGREKMRPPDGVETFRWEGHPSNSLR